MDKRRIGKAIAYLRKRAGYTQQDLADRIGISDKAVSKWERGIGAPDIAYVGKLASLLDIDTDSLLAGDVIHHDEEWRGVLIIPENNRGITVGSMVYSKPIVYFLLSYFMLVGIKNIYVCCSEQDERIIYSEFADGQKLGLTLLYCKNNATQHTQFTNLFNLLGRDLSCGNLMIVSERILLYGVDQTRFFHKAMTHRDHITILSLPKKYNCSTSKLAFDTTRKLVPSDSDDKVHTQYDYYEIPIIFCPRNRLTQVIEPGKQGEARVHIRENESDDELLYTEVLDRGFVEMQIDSIDQLLDASEFVKLVQNACGMEIYCLEEIAWRRGMITTDELRQFGEMKAATNYGQYILSIADRYNSNQIDK